MKLKGSYNYLELNIIYKNQYLDKKYIHIGIMILFSLSLLSYCQLFAASSPACKTGHCAEQPHMTP